MAKKYHCIASKFGAGPLADFCATYYVVLTGFGNHWDDIRANDYERLRDLPPKRYAKNSAFRLFWLRRYLEKGLELMEFGDALRLHMFDLPKPELQHRNDARLRGTVIDSWTRTQGEETHLELILYIEGGRRLRHLSCPSEHASQRLASGNGTGPSDESQLRLVCEVEVAGYDELLYVSRIHVPNRSHIQLRKPKAPAQVSDLKTIVLTPKGADLIAHSVCSLGNGEVTFEPFSLYESDDPKHLSEMCLYCVEALRFRSREVDRDNHLQARVVCIDEEGTELLYRAQWNRVRRLQEGQGVLALTKRVWNTDNRFILEVDNLGESTREVFGRLGHENYQRLQGDFVFTDADELLALLPQEGAEYPVGSLSSGQRVMHPDYGGGIVEGFEETEHGRMVRFHFSGRRFEEVRIKIPASSTLPAYWTDVMLLDGQKPRA